MTKDLSFVVAGSVARDAYPTGSVDVNGSEVTIRNPDGSVVTLEVPNGPINPRGGKYDMGRGLEGTVEGSIHHRKAVGGGAPYSLLAIQSASAVSPLDINLTYVDACIPHPDILKSFPDGAVDSAFLGWDMLLMQLQSQSSDHLRSLFFARYKPPVNLVFPHPETNERIILKSGGIPEIDGLGFNERHQLEELIKGSNYMPYIPRANALLINGLRDATLASYLIHLADRHHVNVYFMPTPSLDVDVVRRILLKSSQIVLTMMDEEQLNRLTGVGIDDDLGLKVDAIRKVGSWMNFKGFLFVTLGQEGMYALDSGGIVQHVFLPPEELARINYHLKQNKGTTANAGDVAIGTATYADVVALSNGGRRPDIADLARTASSASLKHLGYHVGDGAFRVEQVRKVA